MSPGIALPTGTVTFLRTDVEGSMALARDLGGRWDALNTAHMDLIRHAVDARGGAVVRTEGDAVFAAFPEAGAAVSAAVDSQRALSVGPWPDGVLIRVRMGLHTGEAHLAGDDYGGFDVNRAARVAAVGHGGQVIVSETTAALVADRLPAGVALRDLGPHVIRDVPRPERLAQLDIPRLPTTFPPLRASRPDPGDLPDRVTSFIGRDRELAALLDLAAGSRLVTLTGPGGIGKSSLAVEAARRLAPTYRDGAWFVALAAVSDTADVDATIARSIGLFDGPERSAASALVGYLADRSMLLVLDNFEQVLEAAGVVATILRASPESRVFVTSRAPLRLAGEQEYPVPSIDGGRSLFIERARAVRPGWDPGDEAAIADEICALVDGLPLGIELAAARTSLLPLTAIRDRLAARLPLPGSGSRDAPARQQTLEGAVAWSHDLLSPALRTRLHRLGVFEGGFDLEEVGPVVVGEDGATDLLDDLAELISHSLVQRLPDAAGVRFRLLATIQAFALAQLREDGDEEVVRRRHAETYLALAEAVKAHETSSDAAVWIDRQDRDDANLRAAIEWSIGRGETELALRFVGASWRYWQANGQLNEGRLLADRALAMPGADAVTPARMWATSAAGSIAYWQSDPVLANRLYEEQRQLAEALDDAAGYADALFNLGHTRFINEASTDRLRLDVEEAVRAFEAIGDARGVARTRWAVGNMILEAGDAAAAHAIFVDARARFEALDDQQYVALTSGSLAWSSFVLGDMPAAFRWTATGLRETYGRRDRGSSTIALHIGVLIAVMGGHLDIAARLSGAFDALCTRYGVRPPASLEKFLGVQNPFGMVRAALPPERYELEYAIGERMTLGEAVDVVVQLATEGAEAAVAAGPAS